MKQLLVVIVTILYVILVVGVYITNAQPSSQSNIAVPGQNELWLGPIKAWDQAMGGQVNIFGSFEVNADPSKPLMLIIKGVSKSQILTFSKPKRVEWQIQLNIDKQQYKFKDFFLFTPELRSRIGQYAFTIEGTAILVQEENKSNEQKFFVFASGRL